MIDIQFRYTTYSILQGVRDELLNGRHLVITKIQCGTDPVFQVRLDVTRALLQHPDGQKIINAHIYAYLSREKREYAKAFNVWLCCGQPDNVRVLLVDSDAGADSPLEQHVDVTIDQYRRQGKTLGEINSRLAERGFPEITTGFIPTSHHKLCWQSPRKWTEAHICKAKDSLKKTGILK